jgi:hypothetical protein
VDHVFHFSIKSNNIRDETIVRLHAHDMSGKNIVKQTEIRENRVDETIKEYDETEHISNPNLTGQPTKVTLALTQQTEAATIVNHRISDDAFTADLQA